MSLLNPYILAASVTAVAASFTFGYMKGGDAEASKHEAARQETQKQLDDLGDTIRDQAIQLDAYIKERQDLVLELEKQAVSSTGAGNPGVTANGGLQRLQQRWD